MSIKIGDERCLTLFRLFPEISHLDPHEQTAVPGLNIFSTCLILNTCYQSKEHAISREVHLFLMDSKRVAIVL